MKRSPLGRASVALTVVALTAAGLSLAPPAHAALDYGELRTELEFDEDDLNCSVTSSPNLPVKDLVDNGVTTTTTYNAFGSSLSNLVPGDVTTLKATGIARARVTKIGTKVTTFSGSLTASASAKPALANTHCNAEASSNVSATAGFVLPKPMWAEVRTSGAGDGNLQALVAGEFSGVTGAVVSRGSGVATGYVGAGNAQFQAGAQATAYSDTPADQSTSQSGSFSITLRPMGHAFAATGTGRPYVGLGSRSCSSHRISGALTWRESRVRTVAINVNGARKITFTGAAVRKRSFQLAVPSKRKAKVVATVVLKNGKRVTATRSYLACS
jgi:hypothetical protein